MDNIDLDDPMRKSLQSRIRWHDADEHLLLGKPNNPRKDRLVNWQLIFQSYGFIGVIETLSSFAMSYWRWFNLMALCTRHLSIVQHSPYFNKRTTNLWLFRAVAFALCMAIFWLYIPQLQSVSSPVLVEHFFLPAVFGLGMLLLDKGRICCVRWPNEMLATCAWYVPTMRANLLLSVFLEVEKHT